MPPRSQSSELVAQLVAESAAPSAVVALLLSEAGAAGASDVHFEPTSEGLEVRFRLDGVLRPVARLGPPWASTLVSRLKVLAGLATYRTDAPQDGRIPGTGLIASGDLRLSTYPTVRGEKAVVRVLAPGSAPLALGELGLSGRTRGLLESALAGREGMIVLTGPAGSGKTTTLYAAIEHLRRSDPVPRHVVTVEDPVERLLEGVTQTEVRPSAGLGFANCLRSLLRQDPEVLMVGEARDRETAAIAFEAALTGHLVLTTLHAGTATGVVGRFLEMGIEPYVAASVLRLAVAQRLVRKLCAGCLRSAPGCEGCLGTGFSGRIPVDEAVAITPGLRAAVLERADGPRLARAAAADGFESLSTRGDALVAEGLTTRAEVDRILAGTTGEPLA